MSFIEELECPICERPQDDCDCQTKCPQCGGDIDPLDASMCEKCQCYYGDCVCNKNNQEDHKA